MKTADAQCGLSAEFVVSLVWLGLLVGDVNLEVAVLHCENRLEDDRSCTDGFQMVGCSMLQFRFESFYKDSLTGVWGDWFEPWSPFSYGVWLAPLAALGQPSPSARYPYVF